MGIVLIHCRLECIFDKLALKILYLSPLKLLWLLSTKLILRITVLGEEPRSMVDLGCKGLFFLMVAVTRGSAPMAVRGNAHLDQLGLHFSQKLTRWIDLWLKCALLFFVQFKRFLVQVLMFLL